MVQSVMKLSCRDNVTKEEQDKYTDMLQSIISIQCAESNKSLCLAETEKIKAKIEENNQIFLNRLIVGGSLTIPIFSYATISIIKDMIDRLAITIIQESLSGVSSISSPIELGVRNIPNAFAEFVSISGNVLGSSGILPNIITSAIQSAGSSLSSLTGSRATESIIQQGIERTIDISQLSAESASTIVFIITFTMESILLLFIFYIMMLFMKGMKIQTSCLGFGFGIDTKSRQGGKRTRRKNRKQKRQNKSMKKRIRKTRK
jgi:hypothetical protein